MEQTLWGNWQWQPCRREQEAIPEAIHEAVPGGVNNAKKHSEIIILG